MTHGRGNNTAALAFLILTPPLLPQLTSLYRVALYRETKKLQL